MDIQLFSTIIEIIGVISFSISGAMVAIKRKADLFGVVILAIITALGGGLTRDIILSFSPPAIFSLKYYILLCALVAILVFMCARRYKTFYLDNEVKIEHINDIFDSLGLGIFAVMGVKVAIERGFENSGFIAISCGVLTCICGGMLRDVLTKSMPFILEKRIYALAATAGAVAYYYMYLGGVNDSVAIIIGTLVTFLLRILAIIFKWNLPKAIDWGERYGKESNNTCSRR